MKSAGFVPGAPDATAPKVIGAFPDNVTVTVCAELTAGTVPVGTPKDKSLGATVTCACAGSASNNKSGLHTNASANFFMFMTCLCASWIWAPLGESEFEQFIS
jgi:hypothetical protein